MTAGYYGHDLRLVLYEVIREVPTSDASVHRHSDLQALHRRVIAALGEEPVGTVTSDYWLGRFPKPPARGGET